MRKQTLITVLFLLSTLLSLQAQKYSNEFMSLGVGARAHGMGNSIVATVDDVTAGYWNPAALAGMRLKNGLQIGAMHSEWFAGIGKYDYLSVAMPLKSGKRAIGLTAIRFGIDDIPNTLNLYDDDGSINFDNVTGFSSADYGFLGSYSQYIFTHLGKLYVGGNVKIIHRTIGPFAKAWGFGIDAAMQWRMKNVSLGLMIRDISNTFNTWTFEFSESDKKVLEFTRNVVPESSLEVTKPRFIFAFAHHHQWNKFGYVAELNGNLTLDGRRNTIYSSNPYSFDPTFGLEINYNKVVFLRGGINQIQEQTDIMGNTNWTLQPNVGVGLKLLNLHIDYALTDVGQLEDNTYAHVISLVFDLDFDFLKKSIERANQE